MAIIAPAARSPNDQLDAKSPLFTSTKTNPNTRPISSPVN
jgi:hypothetical protein